VADVRITAGSAALNGWTLRFTFPGDQKITNPWNAVVTQDGAKVSAANQTYNATVPARGQVDFGFQASYSGKNTAPPAVTLNGALCNLSK
jgi:cellulase/cellobiase CelA1